MNIDRFCGNERTLSALKAALSAGTLSQGILLCADRGMGASYLAALLACDITGRDPERVRDGKSPAVTTVRGEGASGGIRVEAVRNITRRARYSSPDSENRVFIIEKCENFNRASANALLKSLEEPAEGVSYILTSEKPRMILPTIRSRCSVYTLQNPTRRQTAEYFRRQGRDSRQAERLAGIYGPSIGKIKACLEEPGRMEILARAEKACRARAKGDRYGFSKACFPCLSSRERAKILLGDITDVCRRHLDRHGAEIIALCEKCAVYIDRNANLGLIFENFSALAAAGREQKEIL